MKKDIKDLWRFYDEANSISGIVVGDNENEAKANTIEYLNKHFGKGIRHNYGFRKPRVVVWEVEADDDYDGECKAIAVAYL